MKQNHILVLSTGLLLLFFMFLFIFEGFLPAELRTPIFKVLGIALWFILLCILLAHSNFKSHTIFFVLGSGFFIASFLELISSMQIWAVLLPDSILTLNPTLLLAKVILALVIFLSLYFDKLIENNYIANQQALRFFLIILISLAIFLIFISLSYQNINHPPVNFVEVIPIVLDLVLIMTFVSIGFEALNTYRYSQTRLGYMEKRNDYVFDLVNWGLLATDENLKIISCNNYFQKNLAIPCEPGKDLQSFFPELIPYLQEHKKSVTTEICLATAHGTIDFQLETTPFSTPSGEYGGQIIVLKNLEDVRRMEMEQISYRQILDSSPVGSVVVDKEMNLFLFNKSAERMLESEQNLIPGRSLKELFLHNQIGLTITKLLENTVRTKEGDSKNYEFQGLNGTKIYILAAYPIFNEKKEILGALCDMIDITTEKLNERKLQRAEHFAALGELSAAVAHEIRNPLTSIQGFLQLLITKETSPQNKEYIQIMLTELRRANKIISEFLQYTRPQKLNLKRAPVAPIIEEVAKIIEAELTLKQIDFVFEAEPAPEFEIDGDQFKQVLLNLFQNALQAMEPGGKLTVRLTYDKEMKILQISIEDTGHGIPEDLLENIFTPFFTTKDSGTGLGLSICNRIIQNHGGKIEAHSQLGKGSKFIITLPWSNP